MSGKLLSDDIYARWLQWQSISAPLTVQRARDIIIKGYRAEEIPLSWHALDNPAADIDVHAERLTAAFTITHPQVLSEYVFTDSSQCRCGVDEYWPANTESFTDFLRDESRWPWNFMEIQHTCGARATIVLEEQDGIVTGWKAYPHGTLLDGFLSALIGFPRPSEEDDPDSPSMVAHDLNDDMFRRHLEQAEMHGFLGLPAEVPVPDFGEMLPKVCSAQGDSGDTPFSGNCDESVHFGSEIINRGEGSVVTDLLPEWLSIEELFNAWSQRGSLHFGINEASALLFREFRAVPAPSEWGQVVCHFDDGDELREPAGLTRVFMISDENALARIKAIDNVSEGLEKDGNSGRGTPLSFLSSSRTETEIVEELCRTGCLVLILLSSSDGHNLDCHHAVGQGSEAVGAYMDGLFGFPVHRELGYRGCRTMETGNLENAGFVRHLVYAYLGRFLIV